MNSANTVVPAAQPGGVTQAAPCVHHWVLDAPMGNDAVTGACRACKQTRVFTNARRTVWDRDKSARGTVARQRR
jgi:hypothetical protein